MVEGSAAIAAAAAVSPLEELTRNQEWRKHYLAEVEAEAEADAEAEEEVEEEAKMKVGANFEGVK